jgi:hypothetical protein
MSKQVKIILVIICAIVLVPVVLPLVGIFVFPNLPGHELLLRYLAAISSWSLWPFASIILFIFFCVFFHRDISKKIATTKSLNIFKGNVDWPEEQPHPPAPSEPNVIPSGPSSTTVDDSRYRAAITKINELERLLVFERTIRVMYRSQFDFLQEIKLATSIPLWSIRVFYEKSFRGDKKMVPWEKWVGYLYQSGLVISEGTAIKLTNIGIDFLIFAVNYPVAFLPPI